MSKNKEKKSITVDLDTWQILSKLKVELNLPDLDAVIRLLMKEADRP